MRVVAQARIADGAGSRAMHTVGGVPIGSAFELRITQFDGEDGFYLIRYGVNDEELTDTLHDSLEAAMDQAAFEYGTVRGDWQFADRLGARVRP